MQVMASLKRCSDTNRAFFSIMENRVQRLASLPKRDSSYFVPGTPLPLVLRKILKAKD
jgi:hypothetical protein